MELTAQKKHQQQQFKNEIIMALLDHKWKYVDIQNVLRQLFGSGVSNAVLKDCTKKLHNNRQFSTDTTIKMLQERVQKIDHLRENFMKLITLLQKNT